MKIKYEDYSTKYFVWDLNHTGSHSNERLIFIESIQKWCQQNEIKYQIKWPYTSYEIEVEFDNPADEILFKLTWL